MIRGRKTLLRRTNLHVGLAQHTEYFTAHAIPIRETEARLGGRDYPDFRESARAEALKLVNAARWCCRYNECEIVSEGLR